LIATGQSGVPFRSPFDEPDALESFFGDEPVGAFFEAYGRLLGTFKRHFVSSIPLVAGEMSRNGAAATMYLLNRGQMLGRDTYFQSVGAADGTMARTIAQLGNGSIWILNSSETAANREEFYRRGASPTARFFVGPYFDISHDLLRNNQNLQILPTDSISYLRIQAFKCMLQTGWSRSPGYARIYAMGG
jgi:hypothetical protein